MDAKYYVALRPRTNKSHAVHKEGCPFLPDNDKRIYLGAFNSGRNALSEAKKHFIKTGICQFCSKEHMLHEEQSVLHKKFIKDLISEEIQKELSDYQNLICCLN
jgi:hypothetical protein